MMGICTCSWQPLQRVSPWPLPTTSRRTTSPKPLTFNFNYLTICYGTTKFFLIQFQYFFLSPKLNSLISPFFSFFFFLLSFLFKFYSCYLFIFSSSLFLLFSIFLFLSFSYLSQLSGISSNLKPPPPWKTEKQMKNEKQTT